MRGSNAGSGALSNKDVSCSVSCQNMVHAASASAAGTHRSGELAACKISKPLLQQQQQQYMASAPAAGSAGWCAGSSNAGGSTADLLAGTRGTCIDGSITLGVLIGTGERSLDTINSCRQQQVSAADIMISSSSSACTAANNSSSIFTTGQLASCHHLSTSSGEFALTATTQAGSSRRASLHRSSHQSLQLHTSQCLAQQVCHSSTQHTSQSLVQHTSHSNTLQTSQSSVQLRVLLDGQHKSASGACLNQPASAARRLDESVAGVLADSPYGPQDL